jgi:rubrerythrin
VDLPTTLAAISTAKDFAALIIGRKIDAAVTDKAVELQNSIIALQSGLLEMQVTIQALSQENTDLKDQLAAVKRWEGQQEAHRLFAVAKGVHVYVANDVDPTDEATPWFCATCWERQFRSVLQRKGQDYGGTHYYCPNCKADVYDHSDPDEGVM